MRMLPQFSLRSAAATAFLVFGVTPGAAAELVLSGPDFWGIVQGGNIYRIVALGDKKGFEIKAGDHRNLSSSTGAPDRQGAASALAWLGDEVGLVCPGGGKPKIVMASEKQTNDGWVWIMSPDCRQGSR